MAHSETSIANALRESRTDPQAFAQFYEATAPPLLRALTRRVFDVEVGLDLMAETMAQAFLGRRRFKGTSDREARAWLHAIGGHQVALYYRRLRVETSALRRLGLERPDPPEETEARLIEAEVQTDVREILARAVAELPANQRCVLEARLLRNERYSEIAERLGISETAARARFSRATKSLHHLSTTISREALP